jgi:hypothetical protein
MSKLKLKQSGELKDAAIENQLDMPSSSAGSTKPQESQPILVMLDTTARQKTASRITEAQVKAEIEENYAKMIRTFAERLGTRVEWHKITLKSGRSGLALFFPADMWS